MKRLLPKQPLLIDFLLLWEVGSHLVNHGGGSDLPGRSKVN